LLLVFNNVFLLLFSISRIRHIFLQQRPHVSIMQAEGLLGWTRRQILDDERLYPQMTQIRRRWKTVLSAFICVICG